MGTINVSEIIHQSRGGSLPVWAHRAEGTCTECERTLSLWLNLCSSPTFYQSSWSGYTNCPSHSFRSPVIKRRMGISFRKLSPAQFPFRHSNAHPWFRLARHALHCRTITFEGPNTINYGHALWMQRRSTSRDSWLGGGTKHIYICDLGMLQGTDTGDARYTCSSVCMLISRGTSRITQVGQFFCRALWRILCLRGTLPLTSTDFSWYV